MGYRLYPSFIAVYFMPKFQIVRKFSLEHLGEEWKNCYINFSSLTYNEWNALVDMGIDEATASISEIKKASAGVIKFLEGHFVDGMGFSEGKEVKLTVEDLGELPIEVLKKAVSFLSGSLPTAT